MPRDNKRSKPKTASKREYVADPDLKRVVVLCDQAEEGIITDAAQLAGAKSRSAWMLRLALDAAAGGAVVTLPPKLSAQLVAFAGELGRDPSELIEQWLAASIAMRSA